MTRKEQIEKAAKKNIDMRVEYGHISFTYFKIGAEWADKNPIEHSVKTCTEINQKLESQLNIAIEALNEFKLGHEHAPNLEHTRIMGDTYGWCDFCSTKVHWGPGIAEEALQKINELGEEK